MKLVEFIAKHNYDLKELYIPISFLDIDVARQILFGDTTEKELKWLSKLILNKTVTVWNTDFVTKYFRLIDYSIKYKGDLKSLVMFAFKKISDSELTVKFKIQNPQGIHLFDEVYHPQMVDTVMMWLSGNSEMGLYLNELVNRKISIPVRYVMGNVGRIKSDDLSPSTVEYLYNSIDALERDEFAVDNTHQLLTTVNKFFSMCSTHTNLIGSLITSDCGKGSLSAIQLAKILFMLQFNQLSPFKTNELMSQLSQHIDRVYGDNVNAIVSVIIQLSYYIHITNNTFDAMIRYYKGESFVSEKFIKYMLESEERIMAVYDKFRAVILSDTKDELFHMVTFQAGVTIEDEMKLKELYSNDFEFISQRFKYKDVKKKEKTAEESYYQLSMFWGSHDWLSLAKKLIGK